MTKRPTISIITPSYNQGKYIEATILSVLGQEGDFDLQYLILDGGSTDNTLIILKKYANLIDKNRIKAKCKKFSFWYWSAEDGGQTEALTQGFQMATGKILSWLNSDDYYSSKESVSKILDAFVKHPKIDITFGNLRHVDASGTITERINILNVTEGVVNGKNLGRIIRHNTISQPSTFFRREILQRCQLDNGLIYSMDWDLWIQAYLNGYRFYKINAFIADERLHPQAKTVANRSAMYREWLKVLQKYNLWPLERFVYYKYLIADYLFKTSSKV